MVASKRSGLGRRRASPSGRAVRLEPRERARVALLAARVLRRRALPALAVQHRRGPRVLVRHVPVVRDQGRRRRSWAGRLRPALPRRKDPLRARRPCDARARFPDRARTTRISRRDAGSNWGVARCRVLRRNRRSRAVGALLHDRPVARPLLDPRRLPRAARRARAEPRRRGDARPRRPRGAHTRARGRIKGERRVRCISARDGTARPRGAGST